MCPHQNPATQRQIIQGIISACGESCFHRVRFGSVRRQSGASRGVPSRGCAPPGAARGTALGGRWPLPSVWLRRDPGGAGGAGLDTPPTRVRGIGNTLIGEQPASKEIRFGFLSIANILFVKSNYYYSKHHFPHSCKRDNIIVDLKNSNDL